MRSFKVEPKVILVGLLFAGLMLGGIRLFSTSFGRLGGERQETPFQGVIQSPRSPEEKEYILVGSEVCEEKGDELYIKGTYCPCPEDPGLASVCGTVRKSGIVSREAITVDTSREVFTARPALGGVTVGIYENDARLPTGKPFGNLEKKLVECQSSEIEGKYFCYMRRITPGMQAYVIFACNGSVADIKIINSARSLTALDSDVDCSGDLNHTHLPEILDFANRDQFLGCTSSEPDVPNLAVGYTDPEHTYTSVNVGEEGNQELHTGDIRFSPFEGSLPLLGALTRISHRGAIFEEDCIARYLGNLDREYLPPLFRTKYPDVLQKCNYDPNRTNVVEIAAMEDTDERTTPFRYDVPTFAVETNQVRVFETRSDFQRKVEWPYGAQQFTHAMFGECSMEVISRYAGDTEEIDPIPCEYLLQCNSVLGDPYRNSYTTTGPGMGLGSPISWLEAYATKERDPEDIVCKDEKGNDVKLGQIQPLFPDDDCDPGSPGCKYVKDRRYNNPLLYLAAGGARVDKTAETTGDAYAENCQAGRGNAWELLSTEAECAHKTGTYLNREVHEKRKEQNSPVAAVRVSSDAAESGLGEASGVFTDTFVGYTAASQKDYDYTYDHTIYDVGGRVESLCSLSSINGGANSAPVVYGHEAEQALIDANLISNFFVGDAASHRNSKTAGTSTFATDFGRQRDEDLDEGKYAIRDLFDSIMRYRSGGGGRLPLAWEEAAALLKLLVSNGKYKSFAERVDNWSPTTPAVMDVQYCMSEEVRETDFPPYGDPGYPGNGGTCYPWRALGHEESCGVWPPQEAKWPGNCSGMTLPEGADCPFAGKWPGLEGEMRTCRIEEGKEDQCVVMWKEHRCMRRKCQDRDNDGKPDPGTCTCPGGFRIFDEFKDCDDQAQYTCLARQQDRWEDWERRNEKGFGWDVIEDPPEPEPDDYNTKVSSRLYACELAVAGEMQEPGSIFKDLGARMIQEPLHEPQKNADGMIHSTNYTVLSLTNPMRERKYGELASFDDYATTNNLGVAGITPSGGCSDPYCAITGGGAGATQVSSSGMQAKGFGTGNIVELNKLVAFPDRYGPTTEEFPPIRDEDKFCDVYDKSPLNWCRLIPPPEEDIDLDLISGGACDLNLSKCNIPGLGDLASRILGAAGAKSGVPGSLLLAVIVGEGGWLDHVSGSGRMLWDDESIASYSEPWFARMPNCNEMAWSAQGPFGLITKWYNFSVWGAEYIEDPLVGSRLAMAGDQLQDASRGGGYHDLRVNSEGGIISSKCNFIDAAYAAANMMKQAAGSPGCSISRDQAAAAIAQFRGGAAAGSDAAPEFLVDIAVNCQ